MQEEWELKSWEHFPRLPEIDLPFLASAWSPDGKYLIGAPRHDTHMESVYLYSFESRKYTKLTDFGGDFWEKRAVWLNDSRRVIFGDDGELFLLDTQTKKSKNF